jgi:ribosomal protein S18 acetylase RimI-like enzyme
MPAPVTIIEADLTNAQHQRAVETMTAAYARDAMGNGQPLPPDVLARLVPGLRAHPTTTIFLAYINDGVVGIATCFLGFSTFAARPLINIHDLAVLAQYRGQGIGRSLLEAVEGAARARGCAKLTLEVLESNHHARRVYEAAGFADATYGEATGGCFFYAKSL